MSRFWRSFMFFAALLAIPMTTGRTMAADDAGSTSAAGKPDQSNDSLQFDTARNGRGQVIVSITLPDGGKVQRVSEPVPGRDGQESGFRVLKGYSMPDGTLVAKEITRNSDGSISVLDLNADGRNPDRHEQRMTEKEFIAWVKTQQGK